MMRSRINVVGAALLACGVFASALSAGSASVAVAAAQPNIGKGPYEVPDMTLKYIQTAGTGEAVTPDAQVNAWRSSAAGGRSAVQTWGGYEINEVAGALEAAYPDSYTALARAPEGAPYDYDLVFTSRPPGTVIATMKRLPVKVRIRWGAPLTSGQLVAAQSAVLSELPGLFPGHAPVVDMITSPMSTVLGAFVGGDLPFPSPLTQVELSAALTQAAADATGVDGLSVIAELDPAVAPARTFEVLRGGRGITGCTSGFGAARPTTGARGIITAKHCTDHPYYMSTGIQLGGAVGGPFQRDTQFNAAPSPHTADAQFQSSSGTDFTVVSVANPGYGDPVSKFGKTTLRTDGTVTNANTCYDAAERYCSF